MIKQFETISSLQKHLDANREQGKTIGFVPTMGALHDGHLQLIRKAKKENDIVICSIFVNPAQFNNAADLEKYPRSLSTDMALLDKESCDCVFTPSVIEMYPNGNKLLSFDLKGLDTVMEGVFRPGHFAGMITVVHHLFEIVNPHRAYFGEKDFQQLAIVKYMVKQLDKSVEVIGCPTVRELDGLAMSSRNIHLTPIEREHASLIYKTLIACADKKSTHTPEALYQWVKSEIEQTGIFKLEYVAFVNADTLQDLNNWNDANLQRACIAVITSKTRLIDNVEL